MKINKETYVEILQFMAISQTQVDLIDTLCDKKVLKHEVKMRAKALQESLIDFQSVFFNKDNEVIAQNDILIEFIKTESQKTIDCIEFEEQK